MFFDAVVGNPPYQTAVEGTNKNSALPIYHLFIKTAYGQLAKRASLIHPARCFTATGVQLEKFKNWFINNEHVTIIQHEVDSTKFFPTSDIKGGIAITFYDENQTFKPIGTFIPFAELESIHKKVVVDNPNFKPFSEIIVSATSSQLTKKFHEDNPDAVKKISKGHDFDCSTSIIETFPELFFKDKPNDGQEYIRTCVQKRLSKVWI